MDGELLYGIGEVWLFIIVLILFFLCVEAGYRTGAKAFKILGDKANAHVATIEGALLGLLALLLGFAFSMAMTRYDNRRSIVVEEANDIQTTYLRSKMLPEKTALIVSELLRQYVNSRIEFLQTGFSQQQLDDILKKSEEIQAALWAQAVQAAQEDSDEVKTGYFIESLNNLIDDHTKRVNAMKSHVPEIIYFLLLFVAAMTLAITGYSSGLNQTRLMVPRSIMILLIAATLIVVIDLDRPRRGFIRVHERALLQLQQILQNSQGG